MRKRLLIIALASVGAFAVCGQAFAASSRANDTCPAPFTNGYTCTFQPANVSTTSSTSTKSSSHVKIVVKKTLVAQVRQYQTAHNVVVGFNVMRNGLPKAKQGTCRTGDAAWSEWQTVNGVVQAPAGHHGKTTACLVNGVWRQIGGGPGQWNCGNPIKWMGQQPFKHVPIVRHIITFRTVASFTSTYNKWVSKQASSTTTKTSGTKYTCPVGMTLTYASNPPRCFIAIQVPTTPTNPGPTYVCTINGVGQTSVPAGYINVNGICQQQTTTVTCPNGTNSNGSCVGQSAQAACDQAALNYPGSTHTYANNTCTIIQQVGNCSNQIVIVGNGSPQITQGGNCNSTPPPPTPCVTITSVIDLNDVPENRTSGQLPITVNSCGSGSITIDPGNGGIGDCNGGGRQASITFNLSSGNNSLCVIYYAPLDATANTGSITYTAIQGSAKDVRTDTFAITHPVRT